MDICAAKAKFYSQFKPPRVRLKTARFKIYFKANTVYKINSCIFKKFLQQILIKIKGTKPDAGNTVVKRLKNGLLNSYKSLALQSLPGEDTLNEWLKWQFYKEMNLTVWKSEEVMFKLAPENTQ